uniref:Helicase ATP-binding domain-containing protein n=1 Tax=Sciurus vulgaris TaxID=55149 RepID=A0A8D2CVK8_SCIVU
MRKCDKNCLLALFQMIALIIYLAKEEMERYRHLRSSASFLGFKFAPFLSCVTYAGDKEERAHLQQDLKQESHFHVLLTTYEVFICFSKTRFSNLDPQNFTWSILVVDEAHRLKNQSSLLHKTLSEFSVVFSFLLTGIPTQNSLQELYSLLNFVQYYQDILESEETSELHNLYQPFLLRRVKAEVATEIPKKTKVVIQHVMSALQKKYYKAILMKDQGNQKAKVKLQNMLSQLAMACDWEWALSFPGVEPEPFEVGDHLIKASGKLHLLDNLSMLSQKCGLQSRSSP